MDLSSLLHKEGGGVEKILGSSLGEGGVVTGSILIFKTNITRSVWWCMVQAVDHVIKIIYTAKIFMKI